MFLFNGNELALKQPYLGLLLDKLATKGFSLENIGQDTWQFFVTFGGARVAWIYIARGQGIPNAIGIDHMGDGGHLDTITSLVQEWLNNTPKQAGGRMQYKKVRRSRRGSRKATKKTRRIKH